MDIAVEHTSEGARAEFIKRRAEWGKELRIVDVELTALSMLDADDANVEVDYSWLRADEGTVRVTRVAQKWADRGKGWRLVSEQRLSGDLGLFGDSQPRRRAPPPNAQFPSKTIR
jgi:hypothetical protein